MPASTFLGAVYGYAYRLGERGRGYYMDTVQLDGTSNMILSAIGSDDYVISGDDFKLATATFLPSSKFSGSVPGCVFQMGDKGIGYYRDLQPNGKNIVAVASIEGSISSYGLADDIGPTNHRQMPLDGDATEGPSPEAADVAGIRQIVIDAASPPPRRPARRRRRRRPQMPPASPPQNGAEQLVGALGVMTSSRRRRERRRRSRASAWPLVSLGSLPSSPSITQ